MFLSLALTASAVAAPERPTIPILDAPTLTAACQQAIDDATAAYAKLEALPIEQASVATVLDAWDDAYIALEDVNGPVSTLVSLHPDAKVRDAGRACRLKISSVLGEVHHNDKLFERINAVTTTDAVAQQLKNDIIASFEDNGVTLPKDKRARAKEISDRIAVLAQEYNKNIRDNNTKLTFTPAEYEGLPQSYIERLKKPDGTIEVTLDNPDYFPFMASSKNDEARKRYYIAFYRRGGARNLAILEEVVKLRKELASLHGARSFAHYRLKRQMAETPEAVHQFLDDVTESGAVIERRNIDELRKLKAETLGTPLADTKLTRWDVSYWREQYNQRRFNLDQESTRKYFPPEATLAWLIDVTERVYTLKFENSHAPLWHPDVVVYDVKDASSDAWIGTVYLDLYPREGKFKTAASFSPRSGSKRTGRTPITVVGANFDRKGLSFGSVEVLFHEFGHAMHDLLSETAYASNAGTNTETDFVEAPSQIYEEWARRPQTLALLKTHCSGCPEVDAKVIKALLEARNFGAVFFNSMNYEWARLDMALAGEAPGKPMEHWRAIEGISPLGHVAGSEMPGIFHHILGGYAAGYYGYIWAEVIGKDMLSAWGDNLLDAAVGARFRKTVLARGGEEPAKRMVERFLGRPMSSRAFFDELKAAAPRHFIYFDRERDRIREATFLSSRAEGAQLKYTWSELEPEKGKYDFSAIRGDYEFLQSKGKKLFLQLQDVSFYDSIVNVPPYLREDPVYGGGVARQYEIEGGREDAARPGGWVARRWDPAVRERFRLLLLALGKEFDGRIEGINLAETSVVFGDSGKLFPAGFTHDAYRDAILANLAALAEAFPRSVKIQYVNFMPGEWLPRTDKGYMESVFRRAAELGVGVGGPDLLPYRKSQMNHSYPRLKEVAGKIPTSIAVQDGNYEYINPRTEKRVTLDELLAFANEFLEVDYLFWAAQEPFYSRQVLPFLDELHKQGR